jgi:peptidyl-prolyl cis-trans isomerase SurA
MDKLKGAKAIVHISKQRIVKILTFSLFAAALAACGGGVSNSSGSVDANETAAKINGKVITMEEVDRAVKQQAQGQESKLSPLELAGARLQVLQSLVEQEVMFQKAEKETLVPSDEEVTVEINKRKVDSRLSAEEFNRQMEQAGLNEKAFRDSIKKGMAIQRLVDKVTGRIETPKDTEIEAFFTGNPEMFVRKRGVRLAAIVVDPSDSGQGDTTRNAVEADQRVKEIIGKLSQPGSDFASLAREYSEDSSKLQGGDLGYLSEDDLKQNFPQLAAGFMSPEFTVGRVTNMVNIGGKGYIFKLQERIEKDETLTLESPDVRPQINQLLVDNRKQLLAASYQAIAMNEAKIENFLARKVVDNPNELSGARPAGASAPTANTMATPAPNSSNVVANSNSTGTNAAMNTNKGANSSSSAANAVNSKANR